ncbi:hypothetical protein UB32_01770 [Mesobacillus subterraneus]|uniref:Uncharacterized protein n=1 Tax=Mesobacillus subterraneus TaxID=285983 RepID=A0A0D6ZCS7_9BACI|nr:hypothetical protein UB32_01770 [Mesobacillus subterraneus]
MIYQPPCSIARGLFIWIRTPGYGLIFMYREEFYPLQTYIQQMVSNNFKLEYQFESPFTAWDENGREAH